MKKKMQKNNIVMTIKIYRDDVSDMHEPSPFNCAKNLLTCRSPPPLTSSLKFRLLSILS